MTENYAGQHPVPATPPERQQPIDTTPGAVRPHWMKYVVDKDTVIVPIKIEEHAHIDEMLARQGLSRENIRSGRGLARRYYADHDMPRQDES